MVLELPFLFGVDSIKTQAPSKKVSFAFQINNLFIGQVFRGWIRQFKFLGRHSCPIYEVGIELIGEFIPRFGFLSNKVSCFSSYSEGGFERYLKFLREN